MSTRPRSGGSAGRRPGGGAAPSPLGREARRELIARLRRDARRIAAQFDLEYQGIEPENSRVKRRYGACFSDGRIKIRLTHARTGRPLKYSSMVDTLCHELAHLKHFNHGPQFKACYFRILDWARAEGIYHPGLPAAPGARGHRLDEATAAGAERLTPAPPGLWAQVEDLAQRLRGPGTPPRPTRMRRPAAAAPAGPRPPEPAQLGLFE